MSSCACVRYSLIYVVLCVLPLVFDMNCCDCCDYCDVLLLCYSFVLCCVMCRVIVVICCYSVIRLCCIVICVVLLL